jgi:alpha-L-fucosidase
MKQNSEAIYGTRPLAPYAEGKLRLTRTKSGTVYLIYLPAAGETTLPRDLTVTSVKPGAAATVTLLGAGGSIPWDAAASGFVAHVPAGLAPPNADAWVFRVSATAR